MGYQKLIKLWDITPSHSSKFRTKSFVEIVMTRVEDTTLIAKSNLKLQC